MDFILWIQTRNVISRPMSAYKYIVIVVFSVTQSSFSRNLNCTNLTTSCPPAAQWLDRAKLFNCPGNRRYICLMAPGNELREGCIFNYTIKTGKIGCPCTTQCDTRTGQPVLVSYADFLPCPPDLDGCPPRSHPGYSILEIYKYARCQGRNTSDKSSVSSVPDQITLYGNWKINTISIALGLLILFMTFILVFREKYKGRSNYQNMDIVQAEKGLILHDQQPLLQKQENTSLDTANETEHQYSTLSREKTVSKKKDVQQHTYSSSSYDSDSSQTPILPNMRQETSQLLYKRHLEPSFIISDQDTQLYQASSDGDIETVKELIDAKADANAKTFFQETPLYKAASNGHIDIVKILIDAKADVNAKDLDDKTPLHMAAQNGHIDVVKILIDAEANVNAKGKDKNTPLHVAAGNGHIAVVKILIDAEANVNVKGKDKNTPLHIAAGNGHIDVVKILIDAEANVNAKGKFQGTPLHQAALNSHTDIVKILIDANADVNATDLDYETPLQKAATSGHIDIVKILIDAKADVNAKGSGQNTPLHKAASNGHSDIVKLLIDAKAEVNVKSSGQGTPLHKAASNGHSDIVKILIDAKVDVNVKDSYQLTPLHNAASNGHIDTVKILIDAKADVNAKDALGRFRMGFRRILKGQDTPLHIAASNGHSDIVKLLIDAKADVNVKNSCQLTPLHKAASNGHIDTVKILVDAKADVNAKDALGRFRMGFRRILKGQDTPLHIAASNGHSDIVKLLIDAKADVNVKNSYQYTPLHKAASNGHIDTVKILIDTKADVNAKDALWRFSMGFEGILKLWRFSMGFEGILKDHDTPLHKAASNGHSDIVKILIDAKADVNAKGSDHDTPLHKAASNGHSDIVKLLIDAKADVNAKGNYQDTPLHIATSNGHIDIVKILIDGKADVNAKDSRQETLLHTAALNGHIETMKILIDAKADVNAKDLIQNTPLHQAVCKGHSNIVKMLMDAKSDVNAKGLNQETPLHKATARGHSDIVKMLIYAMADVNAKNEDKNTPLHNAAERGHLEIIRILLSSEADFSIRNNNGKTAEELGNQKSKQVFRDCFEKVPREIIRLGVDAIRQFLKSLNEDAVRINVVSCMFVGHVGVGTITLVNSLLGLPRRKAKMTNGIDLHMGKIFANINTGEWYIQDEQTEKKMIGQKDFTQINIWDFAGKMMYYTMHQDHLYPTRLYCLLFNASVGMDGMVDDHSVDPSDKGKRSVKDYIEFWVTTITTYVQSDVSCFPRIALVGTHIDKLPDTLKISQIIEEIKNKFQPLVDTGQLIVHEDLFINAFDMNAETTRKLRDVILLCGKSYPEYGQKIPRSWNDLHQKLILRKSENVIGFDQLEQMNSQIENPLIEKELTLCMEYFHRLGYLLFFCDEEMKDHVVLDPRWVTNAMLHFITCSNQTSNSLRVQKWLQMQTTGKIEHAYFDEVLLEKHAKASHGHHLQRVMKKLNLVSEPKVYNAKGFEECQTYFYMPCIVNTDISPNALSLIEKQEAAHIVFSFSTVIPPTVYNKLVAFSLSLWPIFDNHIYNGLIILRSGPLHLIAFRRQYTQINMSVVHLEDQKHINVCLCRAIVQFVEQRLTWILSICNTSIVETKSLFHITYNSEAAESLNARQIEEEEDEHCEDCEDRCESDVTQETSNVVDDLFLMRVALRMKVNDIYPLAANVYNHKIFADDLQSDYKELRKSDIGWLILMEWKREVKTEEGTPNLMKLRHVLNEAKINSHILCQVVRLKGEQPFHLDPAYLQTDVHSELLHAVADRISSEYIHVGLELGLKADAILKLLKKFKGRTVEMIRAIFQEWYDKNRDAGHVKVVTLATALLNAKCNISVLHEFEKLHDSNRQKSKKK